MQRIALDARMRRLTVQRVADLSPSLRRVVLGGPELDGFACHGPTDHAKVVFPDEPGMPLRLPDLATWGGRQDPAFVCRDYTVRTYRPATGELVLDMAVHAHGPAGRWAAQAAPGDELGVYGPKTSKLPPVDRAWYLLLADETGLPAVQNWLEQLPADRPVRVVAEVDGPADEIALPARDGVEVVWAHRHGAPAGTSTALAAAVAAVDLPDAGPGWVWAGAEAGAVRGVRRALADRGVDRSWLSMTGYWRFGVANFDHKAPEPPAA